MTITPDPFGHQPWGSPAQPPWTSAMGPYPGPGPALLPPTSGGLQWRPVQTCSFENPPMVLMSGGQSTYGWQVGGMHPTGMLSCFTE